MMAQPQATSSYSLHIGAITSLLVQGDQYYYLEKKTLKTTIFCPHPSALFIIPLYGSPLLSYFALCASICIISMLTTLSSTSATWESVEKKGRRERREDKEEERLHTLVDVLVTVSLPCHHHSLFSRGGSCSQ